MNAPGVQQLFFKEIKTKLNPHLSLVDEVADLLNISTDSAYRRIRGEKAITLEEIQCLASHYKLSIDQFLHLKSDSFIFSGQLSDASAAFFDLYMDNLIAQLNQLNHFEYKHLYYLVKDIPWIDYFQIPELSAFKIFLWMKTFLQNESLKGKPFSLKHIHNQQYIEKGKKIIQLYNQLPATEIWSVDCINISLRQIEYYRQSRLFESDDDLLLIYERLEELINHTEKQAEIGKKFTIGTEPGPNAPDFYLFDNELAMGDNTVLVDVGLMKITFLNHSVINFISTRDEAFGNHMYQAIINIIHKSTQISTVGEKERVRFFNRLRHKIHEHQRLLNINY